MPKLVVPFALRGRHGHVTVSVTANHDPSGLGCDLLDPQLPSDAAIGFPVCEATPILELRGYAAASGWIQVVRSSDTSGEYELDPLALFRDVATPFAFFGIAPVLFDAPFRATRYDVHWSARSFLCAVPDAVMSRSVTPVAAFTWGFQVSNGMITIAAPEALALEAWNDHTTLLGATYPNWRFASTTVR